MTEWWKSAVFYQIYPRSYKDTSGNGVGDLRGIIEQFDYIKSLGIDALWISPFFKSPMRDYGYDVQDYRDVDPLFGTLDDFRELLDTAHRSDIKIMIDMVLSHTSDLHEWFMDSRTNPASDKREFYVWADPKADGTPPNNWLSVFGGPAWSYDFHREQYYMHQFLPSQPDLNVRNPAVQDALLEEVKFWLDEGVDGMRLDAINHCCHDVALTDNPPREQFGLVNQLLFRDPYSMQWHKHDKSQPEALAFMERLRSLTDQYQDIVMLGEIGDDNPMERMSEYCEGQKRLHTCYSFGMITLKPHSAKEITQTYQSFKGDGWPSWALSNHDVVRSASRWSEGHEDKIQDVAKMLVVLLTTLRGTPFLYQGEELGLPEAHIEFDDIQDPWGKFLYPKWTGRDGCRTPMSWEKETANAGFSAAEKTWLPIDERHIASAADVQDNNPDSVLNFTRAFLAWRKKQITLTDAGTIEFIEQESDHILCYRRVHPDQTLEITINLGPEKIGNMPPFSYEILQTGND